MDLLLPPLLAVQYPTTKAIRSTQGHGSHALFIHRLDRPPQHQSFQRGARAHTQYEYLDTATRRRLHLRVDPFLRDDFSR
jgi:hypothetical protein